MWADVLAKPLQGQKFRDMCAFLQNCPPNYDDDTEFKISMKPQDVASSRECVDEHAKLKPILKTKHSSQPRATCPACVSRVTWDEMRTSTHPTKSPTKGLYKGIPQKDLGPKDCRLEFKK
jgi:hypothetical protein